MGTVKGRLSPERPMTRWRVSVLSVVGLISGCGGKLDVCTLADQYVSTCTGRTIHQANCGSDPETHCRAECIVELEPPCSEFTRPVGNPSGRDSPFTRCVGACR